jgi:ketosteroid isomerase-like protein
MKKLILISAFILPLSLFAQNWSSEEKAILNVLNEEGAALIALDMDRIAAIHIQDKTTTRLSSNLNKVYSGWDEIKSLFERYFERVRNSANENSKNTKENVVIKVTGKTAWVVCDNVWKWEEDGEAKERINKEIAFLEKDHGKWKFSFYTFIPKSE